MYVFHSDLHTCAQDTFQGMMDQILDHCEGVIGIADDIIIHGKDDAEHDRRLHKFMKVAREHGLVLKDAIIIYARWRIITSPFLA